MKCRMSTHLIVPALSSEIAEKLTIPNPKFNDAIRMGFSTYGMKEHIELFERRTDGYYLPRNSFKLENVIDERVEGYKVSFNSRIKPRSKQQAEAIKTLVSTENGVLNAGTGTGKTVMALAALAEVGTTTLILVHKEFLMEQWAERIRTFLGEEPGFVQGDVCDYKGKKIVIAMLQTLHSREFEPEFYNYFGLVIADECHIISAETFSNAITKFPAKRRWGLTATTNRSDKLETIFFAHIGEVVYKIDGTDITPDILPTHTSLSLDMNKLKNRYTKQISIANLTTAISKDKKRNKYILGVVIKAVESGRQVMVLGERVAQIEMLKLGFDSQNEKGFISALYTGSTSKKDREFAEQEADVIFGTLQMAKEGLDIPRLDTLIYATPTGAEITVQQSVGRILRVLEGKKDPMVVDLVDKNIPICNALYNKRLRVYRKLNATLHDPYFAY